MNTKTFLSLIKYVFFSLNAIRQYPSFKELYSYFYDYLRHLRENLLDGLGGSRVVYVIIFSFLLAGCKKDNKFSCPIFTGEIITQERNVSYFHTIIIQDKIDVYLKQEANTTVSVKAGKNVINNIVTEIKNETLYVADKNKCDFIRDPKKKIEVYISLPDLKYLKHIGSGNVYSNSTFIQDSMIVRMETPGDVYLKVQTHYLGGSTHGNGDLYVSGSTDYFYYNYNGTNFIYANELKIHLYTYLESHSVGHAYVNIHQAGMDAVLYSNGNIYYTGTPNFLNYTTKAKGKVIKN